MCQSKIKILKNRKFYATASAICLLISTVGFSISITFLENKIEELQVRQALIRRAQDGAVDSIRESEATLVFSVDINDTARILAALGQSALSEDRHDFATK